MHRAVSAGSLHNAEPVPMLVATSVDDNLKADFVVVRASLRRQRASARELARCGPCSGDTLARGSVSAPPPPLRHGAPRGCV